MARRPREGTIHHRRAHHTRGQAGDRLLAELALLHNPASLEGINAVEQVLPRVPQVAVFDTAFHATLPKAARTYPVPQQWRREWGVRRYGFHSLSHAYCTTRAAELLGRQDVRLIMAHLGNGASVSAVHYGICVETSMDFTPLEDLWMGTRSGSIDPGILLYLLREKGLGADQLDHALNSRRTRAWQSTCMCRILVSVLSIIMHVSP